METNDQVCSVGPRAGARYTSGTSSAPLQSTIPPPNRSAIARLLPRRRENLRAVPTTSNKRYWVAASLIVVLGLTIWAAMNGLRIALIDAHAYRSQWCVSVGKYDARHEVIVCDREAFTQYGEKHGHTK